MKNGPFRKFLKRFRIDHFWLESTVWDSIWLKNHPNLTSFETKSMWLVGSQSEVWFSNFTKICKLLFMKRGTKVLCDKRSRFSDHSAHPMHSEQAGLEIWMILAFIFHRKYTRNPSKSVSEPTFPTVIGSTSLSWFLWNLGFSNDFFEITFLLPIWKYFQNCLKHEIPLFTPSQTSAPKQSRDDLNSDQAPALFLFFGFQKTKKVVLLYSLDQNTRFCNKKHTFF